MNRKLLMLAIFTTLFFVSAEAKATIVDLTTANAVGGPVNGAYFSQGILGASGSGNLDAFVRIQTNDPVEEGYNTDGRPVPFDENNSPVFTRAITIGAIPVITRSGIDYFEFLLDINEPNPSDKRLISLDEIKIYQSASGSLNTTTLTSLGALAYDLDLGGDSWIKLNGGNAVDSGSGRADMIANIPVSGFNMNDMANQYVYLYSKFGSNIVNDGGFEEWGVDPDWIPLSNVPEPASLSLLGLGILGLAGFRRKK